MLDHDQALVSLVLRNHVAVGALRLLCKPFDKRCCISDFALRFGERFALLGRHQQGKIVLVREHEFEPLAKNHGTLFSHFRAPRNQCRISRRDGATGFGRPHLWNRADDAPVRGVDDIDGGPGVCINPAAVYIALLAEK